LKLSDLDVVKNGIGIQTSMTGNSKFPNPPVDLAVLKTNLDQLSALVAEAADGSKKVIARKNQQREVVIGMLRLLARYVEFAVKGSGGVPDERISARFNDKERTNTFVGEDPQNRSRRQQRTNRCLDPAFRNADSYQLRYAAAVNGGPPTTWTTEQIQTWINIAREQIREGLAR
jgi:hypothetical protein